MRGAISRRDCEIKEEEEMIGELHPVSEEATNLYCLIRDNVCREICTADKKCMNLVCVESFFKIAGQIELREEIK